MSRHIETKKGLEALLKRYLDFGVTDETKDKDNCYEAKWITCIRQCISEGLAMDEVDYENTPTELRRLWKGLN